MEPDDNGAALRYEIVVRGLLTNRFESQIEGITLEPRSGTTALRGELADQAQLYGLIDLLRDLGLELVSVDAQGDGT